MEVFLVIVVVALALGFDYTNGFHDAANAIATSVSTRALTPRIALIMAAIMNFVGAMLGTAVAETIATSIIDLQDSENAHGLTVIVCALLGAIGGTSSRGGAACRRRPRTPSSAASWAPASPRA